MPLSENLSRYRSLLIGSISAQALGDVDRQDDLLSELDTLWLNMTSQEREVTDEMNRHFSSWAEFSRRAAPPKLRGRFFQITISSGTESLQSTRRDLELGQWAGYTLISAAAQPKATSLVAKPRVSRAVSALAV